MSRFGGKSTSLEGVQGGVDLLAVLPRGLHQFHGSHGEPKLEHPEDSSGRVVGGQDGP
ncbi:MAG: hypothetical protein IVW51_18005 [Thermaceae bacterium]|nr:hypothetical protein [Thermaceae bacterium]